MREPFVLGIAASHNGACCLLHGDRIVAAVQEERLTRRKRQRIRGRDPALCVAYCLDAAGIRAADLSQIVVCVQKDAAAADNDVALNPLLRPRDHGVPYDTISHHLGHAISTFVTSGFDDAAVLVVDGVGSYWDDLQASERTARALGAPNGQETVSLYHADAGGVAPLEKHFAPRDCWLSADAWLYARCPSMPRFQSLGGMYSAAAVQIFGDMDEAGKVMGLAPYGEATDSPDAFYRVSHDGAFVFDDEVPARFRTTDRWPLRQREYENLAASVQQALESALLTLVGRLKTLSPSARLCLAGGVALNSVANQRIAAESAFGELHIIPSADDAGTAIGAAYHGLWRMTGAWPRRALASDGLGRRYDLASASAAALRTPGIACHRDRHIVDTAAAALASGRIVGWFQGRSELGPRALGHRSILCDPRRADAKDELNRRVKHREGFRPFAPAILAEHVAEWFDLGATSLDSPFMLRVARWRPHAHDAVPAVVHVDGTGRLQTVTAANGRFYDLLRAFHRLTGVPILLNTSFNVMGEPIVETPDDAAWALWFTALDLCAIEDDVLTKASPDLVVDELYPSVSTSLGALTLLPCCGNGGPPLHRDEVVARASVRRALGETETNLTAVQLDAIRRLRHRDRVCDWTAALRHARPEWSLTDRDLIAVVATLKRAAVIELTLEPPSRESATRATVMDAASHAG